MSCTPRDQRKAQTSLRIRKAINCLTALKVVIDGILYDLETENATLRARIEELESDARADEIILEASQLATKLALARIAAASCRVTFSKGTLPSDPWEVIKDVENILNPPTKGEGR